MPDPTPIKLSEDELETLRIAAEFEAFTRNPCWLKVRAYMEALVDEAAARRDSAIYADDRVIAGLQRIYDARRTTLEGILGYIEGIRQARRDTMAGIAIAQGVSPEKANAAFTFSPED